MPVSPFLRVRGIEPADHQAMGHEYAGIVEEIGPEVKDVKVGDFGGMIETCGSREDARPRMMTYEVTGF
jgi:Zn-dependent alcohol dehydrogenase